MKLIRMMLICFAAVMMAACGGKVGGKPTLMVSIPPQKYVLERIAGDKWTVGSMIEKATSAESYDPDMSQMMDLENCRAYFVIGNLGFERLAAGKAKTVVDSSKGISVIDGHSHHGEMEADPHVWMSVENMRIVAKNMTDALVKIDSNGKDYYQANYRKLDAELAAFADSLRQVLAPVRGQTFVVWHPALSYFARDYGLEQIGIEYEGKEAPAGFVAEKMKEARKKNARVFFMQTGAGSRQAETVCAGIGLRRVEINPLSYDWKKEMRRIADGITAE